MRSENVSTRNGAKRTVIYRWRHEKRCHNLKIKITYFTRLVTRQREAAQTFTVDASYRTYRAFVAHASLKYWKITQYPRIFTRNLRAACINIPFSSSDVRKLLDSCVNAHCGTMVRSTIKATRNGGRQLHRRDESARFWYVIHEFRSLECCRELYFIVIFSIHDTRFLSNLWIANN